MIKRFARAITVTRPFLPPLEDFCKGLEAIWERAWLTNDGPTVEKLERRLEEYLRVGRPSVFANGTLALEVGLRALGIRGEVITTPFTFVATTNALVLNGARPVFCDIERSTLNIDATQVERLITPRTEAILAVHVFGNPCDHEALQNIADKHGLKLIYDAAHAFGVRICRQSICTFGDLSMISFHATKLFHCVEGGMLVCKDDQVAAKARLMRNFGFTLEEQIEVLGTNAKMSELHALMGLCILPYMEEIITKHKRIYDTYRQELQNIPGVQLLPNPRENVEPNYAYMPVKVDELEFGLSRDQLFYTLRQYNIKSRRYFYPLVHNHKYYQPEFGMVETPVASEVSRRILALPVYFDLALDEVLRICDTIRALQGQAFRDAKSARQLVER